MYYKAKVCSQLNCVASSHTSQMLLRLIRGIESSITKAVNKIFKCIKQHFMSKSVVPKNPYPPWRALLLLNPHPWNFHLKGGGGGAWITPLPRMMKHYISTPKIIFGAV